MHNKTNRKGFTLVEIMIVVVIIGLLAAMAIPAFNKVRLESRRKAVLNNLRQVSSAASQYMLENGVTQVAYSTLAGTGTDAAMRPITPVAGESYTGITVNQTDNSITLSSDSFGTVTFTM